MATNETDLHSEAGLCRANSGAIRFQVKSMSGQAQLTLCGIGPPHTELFSIIIADVTRIVNLVHDDITGINEGSVTASDFIDISTQFQEFWLSWFNEDIRLGFGNAPHHFISYKYQGMETEMVGYIKFAQNSGSNHLIDWIYEASPISSHPIQHKKISEGELRWVTITDHKLPPDALIGGFEEEPIYIACVPHDGYTCPGKYVPSKRLAFAPLRGREHRKTEFQILCGYNAAWVHTTTSKIPQNAFIGAMSVRSEPLYIGRAVYDGHLINGKVDTVHERCYLPYRQSSVRVNSFEILVQPDVNHRSILSDIESEI